MKVYYESKPGELEHGSKPKYLVKIPTGNGKYRYFYSQKELDAYNRDKKQQENSAIRRNKEYLKGKVSKEYLDELEYNSRKNEYPAKDSTADNEGKKTTSDPIKSIVDVIKKRVKKKKLNKAAKVIGNKVSKTRTVSKVH